MDSLAQKEMFGSLSAEMRQRFDLPESILQWVKCRKNLQVAYFKSKPFKWEQELLKRGIGVRTAWSLVHYLEDERSALCAKHCELLMNQQIERLYFCSGDIKGDGNYE